MEEAGHEWLKCVWLCEMSKIGKSVELAVTTVLGLWGNEDVDLGFWGEWLTCSKVDSAGGCTILWTY